MTPLTFSEAKNVVNAVEWNFPVKSDLPQEHFDHAEKMGLITRDHDMVFTRYVTTEKAKNLINQQLTTNYNSVLYNHTTEEISMSIQSFFNYVSSRNPNDTICHESWAECALGEWVKSEYGFPTQEELSRKLEGTTTVGHRPEAWGIPELTKVIEEMKSLDYMIDTDDSPSANCSESLYEVLADPACVNYEYEELETYGDLQYLLKGNGMI